MSILKQSGEKKRERERAIGGIYIYKYLKRRLIPPKKHEAHHTPDRV